MFATVADLSALFVILEVKDVPVSRLVTNLERLISDHPKDVKLRVNLARTHMMAYALKASSLGVWSEAEGPIHAPARENVLPEVRDTRDVKLLNEAREHLDKAITRYKQAIALDRSHPFARLGYAWALDQKGLRDEAIAAYREALDAAWARDSHRTHVLQGSQTATHETIKYLLRLLDPVNDREEIAALNARLAKLDSLPRSITPLVIPLRDGATLDHLIDARARVSFDADGSGRRLRWTWFTPDAGVLVYDPRGSRRITSALQWFGNVTFWLFWENGYEPLRALDDDGDGRLRGPELDGVAVWRDADGNGVSAPFEVAPIADWRVVELSCSFEIDETNEDGIAFSPAGVTFADGTRRTTYDVILHHQPDAASPPPAPSRTSPTPAR